MRTSNERGSPGSENEIDFSPVPSVTSPYYQQQQQQQQQLLQQQQPNHSPYLMGEPYNHLSPFPTSPRTHTQQPSPRQLGPRAPLPPPSGSSYSLGALAFASSQIAAEEESSEKRKRLHKSVTVSRTNGGGGGGGHSPTSNRDKKKRHVCAQCYRAFARSGHLIRHERSHTKEKPFECEVCQSSFGRRDLLLRHNRTVHSKNKKDNLVSATNKRQQQQVRRVHSNAPESLMAVSPVRLHVDSTEMDLQWDNFNIDFSNYGEGNLSEIYTSINRVFSDTTPFSPSLATVAPTGALPQEQHIPPQSHQSLDQPAPTLPFSTDDWLRLMNTPLPSEVNQETADRLGSLPQSLRVSPEPKPKLPTPPETADTNGGPVRAAPVAHSQHQPHSAYIGYLQQDTGGRMEERDNRLSAGSVNDTNPNTRRDVLSRRAELERLRGLSSVDWQRYDALVRQAYDVIGELELPSRNALNRFLGGYFEGLHPNLPFVHVATWNPHEAELPLLLSLCAVGAFYCFERELGARLHTASRKLIISLEARPPGRAPVWVMQTLLVTMYTGIHSGELKMLETSISLHSALALLLRTEVDYLREQDEAAIEAHVMPMGQDPTWPEWVLLESFRRTLFSAFTVFCCITSTFNVPPALNIADISLHLPSSETEWKAKDEQSWRAVRQSSISAPTPTFQEAMSSLIGSGSTDKEHRLVRSGARFSAFGGYVMIYAILIHMYHISTIRKLEDAEAMQPPGWTRLSSQITIPSPTGKSELGSGSTPGHSNQAAAAALQTHFFSRLQMALLHDELYAWQQSWSSDHESGMSPTNPYGPLSFNATALYRVANLRLFSDFSSIRTAIKSMDATRISKALNVAGSSLIERSPDITRTVYPAYMALQIATKLGLRLLSRTAALFWSVEHVLAAFECGIFLAIWLVSIEREYCNENRLSEDEEKMLNQVRELVREGAAEIGMPPEQQRCLSGSVLLLWATTFDDVWVWGITKLMGTSLRLYARHVYKEMGINI